MKRIVTSCFLSFLSFLAFSQEYTDYIGAGQSVGVSVSSSDNQSEGLQSVDGEGIDLDIKGSARFLAHTTMGYTMDEVENLTQSSIETWVEDQITVPASNYTVPTIEIVFELYDICVESLGLDSCLGIFNLNQTMFRYAWWHNTMNGEDKLRQRVALALSEILVISDQSELGNVPHGLAAYYDILSSNAFGNYKDILMDVTYNPSMGFYLSHFNNFKSFPEFNISPDENYAREVMQLFSIGLYELNNDGSRKIDPGTGEWIPTYDNDDIKDLAKVFTGLSGSKWEDENDTSPVLFGRRFARYSKIDPMRMYEEWHETGPKEIVGGVIPDGLSGDQDIALAIDYLFNHPNVGPFLGLRLIQRLVKSNPSPEYIDRVASVFNDNGSGVRGDMEAMIKAIILDEEARACYDGYDETNGMLVNPLLRYTQMMIGLQAETESEWFWNSGIFYQFFAGQAPLSSPTVFNFYTPDYIPDADFAYLNMVGPEYQILNSSTSSNYVNYMMIAHMRKYFRDVYGFNNIPNYINGPFVLPYIADIGEYRAELTDEKWLELADHPAELVDYLDLLLTRGQLSDETKTGIVESLNRADIFAPEYRPDYAAFMILINPEFVILE